MGIKIKEDIDKKPYKILILDDGEQSSKIIEASANLYNNLELYTYSNAVEVLEASKIIDFDAIIIDYKEYEKENSKKLFLELVKYLREEKNIIPTIVLVSQATLSKEDRLDLLNSGVTFFMEKPFTADEVMAIISNLLDLNEAYEGLEHSENITEALLRAIEARDKYTIGHAKAVSELAIKIFDYMGFKGTQRKDLYIGCILHDIGKIGVPDNILKSERKITKEEYEIIKLHPITGYEICKDLHKIKSSLPVILEHHEKLDGSGYPYGKTSKDISILSQICAVADMYHSMTSDRSYRSKMTREKAIEIIEKEAKEGKLNKNFVQALKEITKEEK